MEQNEIISIKNSYLNEEDKIPLFSEVDAGDCVVEEIKITSNDTLLCRRKTTGVFSFLIKFEESGMKEVAKITESGGNRSEQRKWGFGKNFKKKIFLIFFFFSPGSFFNFLCCKFI